MKTIHLRIDNSPKTLCGADPHDREVLWASPGGFKELLDGELEELEACPACKALENPSAELAQLRRGIGGVEL